MSKYLGAIGRITQLANDEMDAAKTKEEASAIAKKALHTRVRSFGRGRTEWTDVREGETLRFDLNACGPPELWKEWEPDHMLDNMPVTRRDGVLKIDRDAIRRDG